MVYIVPGSVARKRTYKFVHSSNSISTQLPAVRFVDQTLVKAIFLVFTSIQGKNWSVFRWRHFFGLQLISGYGLDK